MSDNTHNNTSFVYLRLKPGIRHSQVDFEEIESLANSPKLETDDRDPSVFYFALPEDIELSDANRIVSSLAIKSYIDEAWADESKKVETILSPVPKNI